MSSRMHLPAHTQQEPAPLTVPRIYVSEPVRRACKQVERS